MSHTIEENRLRNSIASIYPEHNTVYSHLILTINKNPTLRPSITLSTLNPSVSEYLVLLIGTIAINYESRVYHMPIKIWLPKEYPKVAPVPMLNPTADMQIQISKHVNQEGYFLHSYLIEWPYKFNHCNLLQLINIMKNIFSINPPLLSRPPPPIPPRISLSNLKNRAKNISNNERSNSHGSSNESQQSPKLFEAPRPPSILINKENQLNLMDLDNPIGDINQLQLKLYQKLSHRFEKFNLANNQLRNKIEIDNQKLNKNNYDINDSIRQLQMINIQSDDNIKILTNNINILEKNCDYLNQLPEITINNLSFDKNKLYKQLVQLIAEENAFEDTYHELSMALSSQRITSKVYFKNVRTLARDQFMVRALIVKIKEKLFIP